MARGSAGAAGAYSDESAAVILPFEEALLREHGIDATFRRPSAARSRWRPCRTRAAARATSGTRGRRATFSRSFPAAGDRRSSSTLDAFVATARELQRRDPRCMSSWPRRRMSRSIPRAARFPMVAVEVVHRAARRRRGAVQERHDDARGRGRGMPARRGVPTSALDYAIGKRLVKIPHIGLVNVVAGYRSAPEFVQDALQPNAVADTLEPLLDSQRAPSAAAMIDGLARVRDSLGEPGAAVRVATSRSSLRGAMRVAGSMPADATRAASARDRRGLARARRMAGVARSAWTVALSRHARRRRTVAMRAAKRADHVHALARAVAAAACIIIAARGRRTC